MKFLDDIELISNFKDRRNETLEELYKRYSVLVYGVCLKYLESREESLDTVVEIFESLMDKIPAHSITNFRSWLYSVTKNHCLMKLRKLKRQETALYAHLINEDNTYHPETAERNIIESGRLESALLLLSEEQRLCIELFYYSHKSYTEISEYTGFSIKSVKSYLQNGKIKLKKILESQL